MNYQAAWDKAVAAGQAAAEKRVPVPMTVRQVNPVTGAVLKEYEPVMDGVCGFAWVQMRPATRPFARWLKKNGLARPSSLGGLQHWVSGYGQSMEKKEAFAYAMAASLADSFPDMSFYGDSRMD